MNDIQLYWAEDDGQYRHMTRYNGNFYVSKSQKEKRYSQLSVLAHLYLDQTTDQDKKSHLDVEYLNNIEWNLGTLINITESDTPTTKDVYKASTVLEYRISSIQKQNEVAHGFGLTPMSALEKLVLQVSAQTDVDSELVDQIFRE